MPWLADRPYNELPLLPPRSDVETRKVLRQTVAAARALGELKQAGAQLPNQSVLVNSIPLLEAQVSSEIENIVATSDALFRFSVSEDATFAEAAWIAACAGMTVVEAPGRTPSEEFLPRRTERSSARRPAQRQTRGSLRDGNL